MGFHLRYERRDPHYVSIVVRPASLSQRAIHITVTQKQDAMGNWLIPTITISEAIPQTSEDVIFMRSIADGLLVACIEFMIMMGHVK